jgi:hypothetical protein
MCSEFSLDLFSDLDHLSEKVSELVVASIIESKPSPVQIQVDVYKPSIRSSGVLAPPSNAGSLYVSPDLVSNLLQAI